MITINDFVKMNDTDKCNLVNKHLQNHTQKKRDWIYIPSSRQGFFRM